MLLLHCERRASAGFGVACPPVYRLLPSSSPAEVGATLRLALSAYVGGQPDPPDWKQFRAVFLKATGFRSWSKLEGNARSCWITEDEDQIKFTPLKNGGRSGPERGFQPIGAADVIVASSSADHDVGRALLLALEASR